MVDAKKAYQIIKAKYPNLVCIGASDFGTFFLFVMAPDKLKKGEIYSSGFVYDAIMKANGKHFLYDIRSNDKLAARAKEIKIESLI